MTSGLQKVRYRQESFSETQRERAKVTFKALKTAYELDPVVPKEPFQEPCLRLKVSVESATSVESFRLGQVEDSNERIEALEVFAAVVIVLSGLKIQKESGSTPNVFGYETIPRIADEGESIRTGEKGWTQVCSQFSPGQMLRSSV